MRKQPSRAVLRKRFSENMLCNFIEIALRHGCSPVTLLHIFRTHFLKNSSGGLLLNWLKKSNLKRFIEALICSAQEQVLRTNNLKLHIDKTA